MDRLPEEILCDIFRRCLTTYTIPTLSTWTSVPVSISHVCRTWRSIVLSCGDLWSYMHIEIDEDNHDCDERKLTVMKNVFDTWLLRSGRSPLNITLKYLVYGYWDCPSLGLAGHIIKALVDQQRRWKDMTIHCDLRAAKPSDLLDIIILNDMPLLTSLDVDVWHSRSRIVVDISRSLRLERIILRGADLITAHNSIETLRLPSSFTFDYRNRNPDDLRSSLSFLRAAPNLKLFRAIFNRNNAESMNAKSNTGFPHLSHQLQTLDVQSRQAALLFMDSVTLPSLQALACSGIRNDANDGALLRFIQRSMPPLTYLDVVDVNETTLLPILRLLPTLVCLRVARGHFTQRFFQELFVPDITDKSKQSVRSVVVCPELVSFRLSELDIREDTEACNSALIDMAKSRHKVLGTFDDLILEAGKYETRGIKTTDVTKINRRANIGRALMESAVVIRSHTVPPDAFPDW